MADIRAFEVFTQVTAIGPKDVSAEWGIHAE